MTGLPSSALQALLAVRLDEAPLEDTLERFVAIAKDHLTGADEVSITLVRRDKPFTAAYTGQLALDADEMQYARGYGPCIDAGLSGSVLMIEDTRTETRWPDYVATVAPRGVLSSMSVPLPVQTDVVGALNCYSRTAGAFPVTGHGPAVELAGLVGVAVANAVTYTQAAQLAEDLRTAMLSRAAIEQAKGVIMAQNRCDPDQAFDILRRASMGRNVKLRELAAAVVAGVVPPPTA